MSAASYTEIYLQYLERISLNLGTEVRSSLEEILNNNQWEDPTTGSDWNSLGVMALIEAEQTQDLTMRSVFIEMAVDAWQQGCDEFPLCAVHLALVKCLLGENQASATAAYEIILNLLALDEELNGIPKGLLYIPQCWSTWPQHNGSTFTPIFKTGSGFEQILRLASEVLWRSQFVFYSPNGLKTLQLASQISPDSAPVHLRLGVSSLVNNFEAGLLSLHRARAIAPDSIEPLQALYIACRDQGQWAAAQHWQSIGQKQLQNSHDLTDRWTKVPIDQTHTYAVFDETILLVVEPSFRSIVTSVLVAEGDWFEQEMEWWRQWIQPGMTVIDVGANVGVYTFSAAKRVGRMGCVIAVEPFSGCVSCLEETRRLNQMDWVKVVSGAASNHDGTAYLSLSSASELNELIPQAKSLEKPPESAEQVNCFTLDGLCDRQGIKKVDLLKIDAEGHELAVLAGSEKILSQSQPVILYENIAGRQGSNPAVTHHLRNHGYDIFRYQSFTQTLIPVELEADCEHKLNLIAFPQNFSQRNN